MAPLLSASRALVLPSRNQGFATRARASDRDGAPAADKVSSSRGWFYDKFVSQNTMEAKLNKLKADVAARNGYVGSLFDDAFKYTAWIEIHRKLTERNLVSLDCDEAYKMMKSGDAVLIDVRECQPFEKVLLDHSSYFSAQDPFFLLSQVHGEGTKSAPLFRQIQGNDLKANARRLGFALLTNFSGTERNPEFVEKALDAVNGDKNKKVIVLCSIGGTLLTYVERTGPKAKKFKDPERFFGRQSRSLKAAYELQEAGFTNVFHLQGGFNEWIHRDLPTSGTAID
ncbi:rhodanese-like domain-containing protein 14, chloroplastic isoform X1 [Selaginella moellendorffii]|uniref:rhodanese-like domain-containing protein 14, chloroplastic isoform X1 n=1 Tax=Selaginella moellendorffii TaxID=88036 RepID=UPI000D1CB26F|nr:rhodanese-like domain-containing protein 14, chloroplastic isoform X1 [Selaginella moellendorffii]|eukprot:XP_024518494.1 rhodanese-like domain-containing protein 14, chloroplastic isoform X1 [Selaginella moellendorffii]